MIQSNVWLVLNASVVWLILSYAGVSLFRSKALFACLLILPVIILPNLMSATDQWIKWYVLSIIYGIGGIVLGVILAEIQRTKKILANIHKPTFFVMVSARFCIGLSGVYIFVYLAKTLFNDVIGSSSIIKLVLDSSIPKLNTAESLMDSVHFQGVVIAVVVIVLAIASIVLSLGLAKKFQKHSLEDKV